MIMSLTVIVVVLLCCYVFVVVIVSVDYRVVFVSMFIVLVFNHNC